MLTALGLAATLRAVTVDFTGGLGWENPASWLVGGLPFNNTPGPGDTVRLLAGTAGLGSNTSVGALQLGGGNLSGAGTLTITGTGSSWTSGSMHGSGTTVISAASQLTLTGAAAKNLYHGSSGSGGRTLDNQGTTTWQDAGNLLLGDGAQILNRAGAVFAVQNDATLGYAGFGNGGTFANTGSFVKSSATGTTTISNLTFANQGLVEVQNGTVAFTSTLTSAGEFRTSAMGSILFSGNQAFNSGTSFTGSGVNKILGGTTTFSGSISSQNLEFAGGGGVGTATIAGDLQWTGGDWYGGNTFTFTGGTLAIGGAANKNLYHGWSGSGGRVVSVAGSATWDGPGLIRAGDGAGIEIQGTGSLSILNDSALQYLGAGGAPFLTNAGTLTKTTGPGTTTFSDVGFTNTGTTSVQTGTLLVTGGSAGVSNLGAIEVYSGASFVQAAGGGSSSGSFLTGGTGLIQFTGGVQTLTTGAAFLGSGLSEIAGGTVNVAGTAAAGTPSNPGTFRLTSGTFGGSGTFTVNVGSTFQWRGGSMTGPATLQIAAGGTLAIDGAAAKNMYHGSSGSGGHTIANAGTITWQGTGAILGGDGAQFVNQAGGLFDAQNDATFGYIGFGNGLTFTNAGTFRKSAGTGTTSTASTVFNSSGAVEVNTGILALAGGGTSNGSISAGAAGLVSFTNPYTLTGGNIYGAGGARIGSTVTVAGATAVGSVAQTGRLTLVTGGLLNGSATLSIHSGSTLEWTGGDMAGPGTTAILAGGQLLLTGAAGKSFYHGSSGSGGRTLSNAGTIRWQGTGSLLGGDGATINNLAGGVFDVQENATLGYVGFGNGVTFNNAGLFKRSAGSGTFTVSAGAFHNPGTVQVQAGTLALNSGGTSSGGNFAVSSGAQLVFGATYSFDGAQISGAGTAAPSNTTLVFGGVASLISGHLLLTSGSAIAGGGELDVSGTLTWTGGDMNQSGLTKVLSGGQILLAGAANKALYHGSSGSGGRTLENLGLTALDGTGLLVLGDGATIINRSTGNFDLRSDSGVGYAGFGNGGSFLNEGLLQKSAGAGVSTISQINFTNHATGTVWAKTGTLAFTHSVTSNGGTFQTSAGATIQFSGGAGRVFDGGTVFSGAGTHLISNGTTTFNGDFTANNLTYAGGFLTGSGTLHGAMTWTGGDWGTGGTFIVASNGLLRIDGAADKNLYHGSSGSGGRVLVNQGLLAWQGSGSIRMGDGAQITNTAGATLAIQGDATLGYIGFGNTGTVVNSGQIIKSASPGTTTIALPYTQASTGSLIVTSGTLAFTSSFANTNGTFTVASAGQLSVPAGLDVGSGMLSGWGTVTAPGGVNVNGVLLPLSLSLTGGLTLGSTALTTFEIGGSNQGITSGAGYSFLGVAGSASLNGNLALLITNGFQASITPSATFTLLTAGNALSGAFLNIPNGQRLVTADGLGSFLVNYGGGSPFAANSLVLSQFVAVPEPSTWALLAVGLGAILIRGRRRR